MYNLSEIAKRLKEKRLEMGFSTQRMFAEKININASTISAYEKGNKLMTLEHLTIICASLNCSLDWLMFGVNNTPLQLKIQEKTKGEQIAEAIVTLIDNDIISKESIEKINTFSRLTNKFETHHSFQIYIRDYHYPMARNLFEAYYVSVKELNKEDDNRKHIAASLIKTYKDKLD